jgi:peptide-methionine (R)-S-oxide reductase
MSRFRTRFALYLAASTFLGLFIALPAFGQEPPDGTKRNSGDDPAAAAGKAGDRSDGGGKEATGKDEPGTGTDGSRRAGSKTGTKAKAEPEFVRKTDAEWRKILTKTQYMVTRQKATEPAFSGKYASGHFRGMFLCVCCDAELFNAQNKFDSGTGWPSFDRPANARAVGREMDYSAFEPRVEVMCRRCGAHLGHIFDDGPTITTLRFCINSAAIKLRPPEGESASTGSGSSRSMPKGRTKARPKPSTKTKAKAEAAATGDAKEPADGAKGEGRDVPANSERPSSNQGF